MIKIERDIYRSTFNIDAAQTIYKLFAGFKKYKLKKNAYRQAKIITAMPFL